ncbi:DNA repair protein RecN [Mariniplasma anaerobium]|uniref:DNA repair protein RecN n=1 Tax=Mariniplasma anaerobium TaxID=2735436 RepID=A0A7U9TJU2_9MOLU|nr:DNA repair protein RecN [Mariniplasma anaerobium]BCR36221.1 DNA repair protein RecN [Mariniplasma anaerobium]
MIRSLKVSHFALIEDLEITFDDGLTALTGETGAGKTIILESLHLLFGKRSDQTMIRYGEQKAVVIGEFELTTYQQELLGLNQFITVRRDVDASGRHQMKINDETVTLNKLREIMLTLGDIHQQNDSMTLFDKSYYLSFIDQVDQHKIDEILNAYLIKRSNYIDKKSEFTKLKNKKQESVEKQSFLEYQIKELDAYQLIPDEKQNLEEELNKLKNYDKIMNQFHEAYEYLDGEAHQIDHIYEAALSLEKIKDIDQAYHDMFDRLSSSYYEIDDVKSILYQQIENLDFDQEHFNFMQQRHYDLEKIEQKYQKDINDLIDYTHEIKKELLMITDFDQYLKEAQKEVDDAFDKAFEVGLKLSNLRKKLAKKLASEMIEELKDLDLDKSIFDIIFDPIDKLETQLLESGLDQVEFMISLNEGEPVKPLAKVASGGERARFMFALKSVYAKANRLSMLVLDEIDIGISGRTAAKVAQKMKDLSKNMQLIVITHLPQVAAKADHHYGIHKIKENQRMVTHINRLDMNERIEMIALMLSDEKLSHFAIEQAKMLLNH